MAKEINFYDTYDDPVSTSLDHRKSIGFKNHHAEKISWFSMQDTLMGQSTYMITKKL